MSDAETPIDIVKEFYANQITLVVGETGSGKSWYAWNHPLKQAGFYLDLEDRYKEMSKHAPQAEPPFWENCKKYTADYSSDPIATFDCVKEKVDQLISENEHSLYVIDGVSDLRRMAQEKWEAVNNKQAYGMAAWGEINEWVKKILFRMFNFCRIEERVLVITAWIVPEYNKQGERTGKQTIDLKEFITAQTDAIIAVKREGARYFIRRAKAPQRATEFCQWDIGWNVTEATDAEEPTNLDNDEEGEEV